MRKNVLVFPCGSEIALEIHRAVHKSIHFNLIGASSVDDHGKFVYEHYIDGVPFITEDNFIPAIKSIVREHSIDAIYPAMDAVIAILKRHERELGCVVVASPPQTAEVCLSKTATYSRLQDAVLTPRLFVGIDAVETFPVFAKPDVGYGSRGAKKCLSKEDLKNQLEQFPTSIILEYLPGEEYTVDCFTTQGGELLACYPRIRSRIMNGISVNTKAVGHKDEFLELAKAINGAMEFSGAWFFQVKRNSEGKLTLLEMASRFAGSSSLFRAKGVNFALMSLYNAFGIPVSILENDYEVELDRALDNKYKVAIEYDEVFVDFDDCLFLEGRYINDELAAFLFRCRNKGIRITLITKHDDARLAPLDGLLEELKIKALFDRVIHLEPEDRKHQHIDNRRAIFIDDSFAERKAVKESCGLPVFSVDMVEVL